MFAVFPGDFDASVELLAGYPFHIAPGEILDMDADSLRWWVDRAGRRLQREQADKRHGD